MTTSLNRDHIEMRGIYGGVPAQLLEHGHGLEHYGVNAIFMGCGGLNTKSVGLLREQGARLFAEFNTMHCPEYLLDHPDAAPLGVDGNVCPPPDGWQGVCPTHPAYRQHRMDEFRRVLTEFPVDGMWLDYHHSHANWECADPLLPDTCFCDRCLSQFQLDSGITLPPEPTSSLATMLLSQYRERWVQWRCDVFTDWVREFRGIIAATRPAALLGTYHCPWSESERDGALRAKLAIDLKAQSQYLDVFSTMPYHARFGHHSDPEWISRQTRWLGDYLGIEGKPGERHRIWPIVQLSDWGEHVPASQVREVLQQGTALPSTGVMVFNWGGLKKQMENVTEMAKFYREIA